MVISSESHRKNLHQYWWENGADKNLKSKFLIDKERFSRFVQYSQFSGIPRKYHYEIVWFENNSNIYDKLIYSLMMIIIIMREETPCFSKKQHQEIEINSIDLFLFS